MTHDGETKGLNALPYFLPHRTSPDLYLYLVKDKEEKELKISIIFQQTFSGSRMMFSYGRREPFHKLIVEGNGCGRYDVGAVYIKFEQITAIGKIFLISKCVVLQPGY